MTTHDSSDSRTRLKVALEHSFAVLKRHGWRITDAEGDDAQPDRIAGTLMSGPFVRQALAASPPATEPPHMMSADCWCHPKVEYVPPDQWWADAAMVNGGKPGDEHFIGDAASDDDANRIVEAHNEALAGPAPTQFLPPTDFSKVAVLTEMPEGLDPERSPFTADRDNELIYQAGNAALSDDRYLDRVRLFNATEAQVRYALTALDEHEPGWREKVR